MSKIQFSDINELVKDISYVIGNDECGYGSLAGPLVVCAVMAPKDWSLAGLNDSKKLSPKRRGIMRDKLNELIVKGEIWFHLAERSNVDIDKFGVAKMLKDCYVECFTSFAKAKESLIIIDGILKFDNCGVDDYNICSLIKADTLAPSVMAASILAKTYRDGKMKIFHELHPQYNWMSNVGYGSADHMAAMRIHGLSPLHRRSYKVKTMMDLYE